MSRFFDHDMTCSFHLPSHLRIDSSELGIQFPGDKQRRHCQRTKQVPIRWLCSSANSTQTLRIAKRRSLFTDLPLPHAYTFRQGAVCRKERYLLPTLNKSRKANILNFSSQSFVCFSARGPLRRGREPWRRALEDELQNIFRILNGKGKGNSSTHRVTQHVCSRKTESVKKSREIGHLFSHPIAFNAGRRRSSPVPQQIGG